MKFADIHLKTDVKNPISTARTINLPEQKKTMNMISILKKKAFSGCIHDLVHISIQICLPDCLTKTSAKTDNLITAVKTGKLLQVDIHPNLRTHMEHKVSFST